MICHMGQWRSIMVPGASAVDFILQFLHFGNDQNTSQERVLYTV